MHLEVSTNSQTRKSARWIKNGISNYLGEEPIFVHENKEIEDFGCHYSFRQGANNFAANKPGYIWEWADCTVETLICQTTLDSFSRTGIPHTPYLCRQGQWFYLEILEWVSPPVYITTTIAPLTHHVSQPGPQRRSARYALPKIQFRINDLTNQL